MSPLWDWTKGITQSGIESFLACREQFALGYVDGWAPRKFSEALEFGSMFHFMQEKIGSAPPEIIAKEVTKSYEATRKKTILPSELNDLELTLAKVEAIFPLYVECWQEDDAKIQWLEHEQVFRVDHKFLTVDGAPSQTTLTGMRDKGYRRNGNLGLFETKTKSSIDDVAIQDGLRADLQTLLYLLALRYEYNEEPKEILYNIVRRPQLKLKKDEHVSAFKQRIIEDIKERPEWYFRRFEVTVVPGDIDLFVETTLDPVLRNMLQWWESIKTDPTKRWESPYHYRSLPALMTKYGKAWHYNLTVRGLKNEYYRKSSPFPELELSNLKGKN